MQTLPIQATTAPRPVPGPPWANQGWGSTAAMMKATTMTMMTGPTCHRGPTARPALSGRRAWRSWVNLDVRCKKRKRQAVRVLITVDGNLLIAHNYNPMYQLCSFAYFPFTISVCTTSSWRRCQREPSAATSRLARLAFSPPQSPSSLDSRMLSSWMTSVRFTHQPGKDKSLIFATMCITACPQKRVHIPSICTVLDTLIVTSHMKPIHIIFPFLWTMLYHAMIVATSSYLNRFLCLVLGPHGSEEKLTEMGRALGTLMSDQVGHDPSWKNAGDFHYLVKITIWWSNLHFAFKHAFPMVRKTSVVQ